jgi:hypothetical protein
MIPATFVSAEDYTLEQVSERPAVAESLSSLLNESGHRILGPKRGLCDVWFVKDLAGVEGFKKSPTVTYPFTPGQLIGVMVVPRRSELTDFKGNKIVSGTYTLRYGRQPQDGNHVGTSDTLDFLMALPLEADESTAGIDDQDELAKKSAGASGTTHPAVFSLLPMEKAEETARFVQVESKEMFVLETVLSTKTGKVPVRLVLVGISEGA